MQETLFSQIDISEETQRAIDDLGFINATEIQTLGIPLILEGRDVIGHSQTGTGKTAAFGIPAIELIENSDSKSIQVLILCPTRELATQACDELRKFAKYKHGIKTVPIYGGQSMGLQVKALKEGAQIVVGTPGRIMDHMRRKTLKLDNLSMIVLDEADEMLNMGFREDIETIMSGIGHPCQTVLFSATMSKEILAITKKYQTDPILIKIKAEEIAVSSIKQYYLNVPSGKKEDVLIRLLEVDNPIRSIIFCNTKNRVDELTRSLKKKGFSVACLHGDIKQDIRSRTMNAFKNADIDILIATDVAARGIDVSDIEAVFNYDVPQDVEYYVHRIGRTGRAGKTGVSYTFVSGSNQMKELMYIKDYTKSEISLRRIPSVKKLSTIREKRFLNEMRALIESGTGEKYDSVYKSLLKEFSVEEIIPALIGNSIYGKKINENLEEIESIEFEASNARESRNSGRNRRDEKRTRKSTNENEPKKVYSDENMVNLEINIGRRHRVSASHLLRAFAGASKVSGKSFGRIEIYDKFSLIGVPKDKADAIIKKMKSCKIVGFKTITKKA